MRALEFRFAFYARDFEASIQFYKETLGMTQMGSWDKPDGRGALLSAGGRAVMEIHGAAEGQTYEGPAPVAIHLAVCLAGAPAVDAYYERLSASGARLEGPPEERPWGHYSFIVYDPDGIPLHIYSETGQSPD